MERLLVSGIETLVGSNLALALRDRCEVLGLSRGCTLSASGLRAVRLAADDHEAIEPYLEQWQPHWIVHCGPLAASSWDPVASDSQFAQQPPLVARLAEWAQQYGSRLTVISSDVVFCGPRMFHEEGSPATNPAPRAEAVRSMERVSENGDVLMIRTHAYGWGIEAEPSGFAELAFEAVARRAPLTPLLTDGRRHATPILATDLAELLWRAYESRLHGLYHLSGTERTSPHRFVSELAYILGLPIPCDSSNQAVSLGSGNAETSLSSRHARRMLGATTPLLREGLRRFAAQAQNGWRDNWQRVEVTGRTAGLAA